MVLEKIIAAASYGWQTRHGKLIYLKIQIECKFIALCGHLNQLLSKKFLQACCSKKIQLLQVKVYFNVLNMKNAFRNFIFKLHVVIHCSIIREMHKCLSAFNNICMF